MSLGVPSGSPATSPYLYCKQLVEDSYYIGTKIRIPLWAFVYTLTGAVYILLLSIAAYVQDECEILSHVVYICLLNEIQALTVALLLKIRVFLLLHHHLFT